MNIRLYDALSLTILQEISNRLTMLLTLFDNLINFVEQCY